MRFVTPTKRRWTSNDYITRVKTRSQLVGDQMSWRSEELEIRCSRENQHPERLGPQAPGWATQENGKEMRLCPIEWRSICCSSIRFPTPSHTQPFQIKWEVYFSSLLCRCYDSACRCICIMWLYNKFTEINFKTKVFSMSFFLVSSLSLFHYTWIFQLKIITIYRQTLDLFPLNHLSI